MAAQEEAIPHAVKDIVYVAKQMYDVGADGINLDTSGAAGDARLPDCAESLRRN